MIACHEREFPRIPASRPANMGMRGSENIWQAYNFLGESTIYTVDSSTDREKQNAERLRHSLSVQCSKCIHSCFKVDEAFAGKPLNGVESH